MASLSVGGREIRDCGIWRSWMGFEYGEIVHCYGKCTREVERIES